MYLKPTIQKIYRWAVQHSVGVLSESFRNFDRGTPLGMSKVVVGRFEFLLTTKRHVEHEVVKPKH
jgi:hypothetical protein